MGRSDWGKEPFDLRLTVLRLIRRLPQMLAVMIAGTLLTGCGYLAKKVWLAPDPGYRASATFLTEYSDPDWFVKGIYINDYSWNIWLDSDEFTGYINQYLPAPYSKEKLSGMLEALVYSDLRVMEVFAYSRDPEEAELVIQAVKRAMTEDFPRGMSAVDWIRVTDEKPGQKVTMDVRPARAFLLGGIVSVFFTVVIFLLMELWEDKIWLPTTLGSRYGLKQAGIPGTETFRENMKYFFRGKNRVALCPVDEDTDPAEVAQFLTDQGILCEGQEFLPLPTPVLAPEVTETLRGADGILLICPAGSRNARNLEFLLDFLKAQDCEVTAALLWKPDEWLVKSYYCLKKEAGE